MSLKRSYPEVFKRFINQQIIQLNSIINQFFVSREVFTFSDVRPIRVKPAIYFLNAHYL